MTTGSEPRRYRDFFANGGKIELCDDCGGLVGWTGLRDGCCLGGVVCERTSTRLVESVEPGHDEQTEACRVCGGRGWHTAGGNDPAACGACAAGEAWYGGEWQPDPRTVAAVVQVLLDNPKGRNRVLTVGQAVDHITERLNPSKGTDGR